MNDRRVCFNRPVSRWDDAFVWETYDRVFADRRCLLLGELLSAIKFSLSTHGTLTMTALHRMCQRHIEGLCVVDAPPCGIATPAAQLATAVTCGAEHLFDTVQKIVQSHRQVFYISRDDGITVVRLRHCSDLVP